MLLFHDAEIEKPLGRMTVFHGPAGGAHCDMKWQHMISPLMFVWV